MTVGVVVFGVYQIGEGEMTVGALVAATILAGRTMAPLAQIAGLCTRFQQSRAALKALDQIMKMPVERPLSRSFLHRPRLNGDIEFKKVVFAYPNQQTPVLDGLSFSIKAGERVGVIGRIGSGKSTIERLILGLYEPAEGSVLVDGTDVRQIDPADLRRNIGCIPQEIYLFSGSVRDNIAFSAPEAGDDAVLRAAKIAGVEDFVRLHPQGFDLQVGERGDAVSGGQRQAIALARALLAPIHQELSIGGEFLDPVVERVGNEDVPVPVKSNSGRAVQLAVGISMLAPLGEHLPFPGDAGALVRRLVGNPEVLRAVHY